MEVLGVGDDLVALLTLEPAGRDEVLVGVDEQAQEGRSPRGPVGLEDGELLGRRDVVGLELDVEVEGRVVDARGVGFSVVVVLLIVVTASWRFWRTPMPCPRRFGAVEVPWHPRPASQRRPLTSSVVNPRRARILPAAAGGGTAGPRSRG